MISKGTNKKASLLVFTTLVLFRVYFKDLNIHLYFIVLFCGLVIHTKVKFCNLKNLIEQIQILILYTLLQKYLMYTLKITKANCHGINNLIKAEKH